LIRYRIRPADLDRHHFEVECRIDDPRPAQHFSLPSWIPGSYLLREFARHVVAVEAVHVNAHGEREPLPIEKTDHSTWCCRDARGALVVTITVYALDQSVRGAYVDRRRAYFNGPCVFLQPDGRDGEAVELHIERPADAVAREWRVATAMRADDVDEQGFGRYRAVSYDELIDHPVEIGPFARVDFEAAGVPHHLVLAGRFDTDLERVAADLRRLCETQIDFFGRPLPFERYWFLGLAKGDGYGGLEHRASSSLIFNRDDLPKPGEPGVPRDYQRFLALASHEYFHTWHVKRTRPAAFVPYRLDRRNHTRLLWVFEGITSYYQDLFVLRAGLVGADVYLRRLGEIATRVYRVPGRFRQSVAQSSFDAWDVLYKPEANTPNASVSYYSKGALVALALDLTLRRAGTGATLDRVVQELWRRYGARDVGVPEDGLEALAVELCGEAHAARLAAFFDTAVRGTDDLPLEPLLADFAISMHLRASTGPEDAGGTPANDAGTPGFGATYRAREGALELTAVLEGGAAQKAGLSPGDVLIAIDGLKADERNLRKRLGRLRTGGRVPVSYFRGDELLEAELELEAAPLDTCYLVLDQRTDAAALERRREWLGA
jgi:predicted metalloprotease with PDZ domain